MNSSSTRRTALAVIVALTFLATAPIRASETVVRTREDVRTIAVATSDAVPLSATELSKGLFAVTPQLQPTRLKRIGWKRTVLFTAIIVTAVVIYALAHFGGLAGWNPGFEQD